MRLDLPDNIKQVNERQSLRVKSETNTINTINATVNHATSKTSKTRTEDKKVPFNATMLAND